MQLHKVGVTEVVGYFGPIVDELSTRAEATIYQAIAEGRSTRDAVRLAREKLKEPYQERETGHRPSPVRSEIEGLAAEGEGTHETTIDTHPFAWAQLVFYRRGPEWPLSVHATARKRHIAQRLERRFEGFGERKVLKTGFIGRRLERHKIRRLIREGARVLVLQGLGGLGKSTLAQQVIPWLTDDEANVCTLWCQEVEGNQNRAEALVGQLLEYCRKRFGLSWEGVVRQVDQAAGDNAAKRFDYFLQMLVQNAPGLVLYLDNLESLLIGPEDEIDSNAFGHWAEPALEAIWRTGDQMARDTKALYVIASCRYRNDAFTNALLPVTPLPADALFRLTEWFPSLQRLATVTRARLVSRLDGHPRAVQYANTLVEDALEKWRDTRGGWVLSVLPKSEEIEAEWEKLVNPCMPQVAEKLKDNLLLQTLWDRVLDEHARRFLYRMTVLRQPAEWDLLELLGEPNDSAANTLETAQRLRDTSLLEQVELQIRVSKDRMCRSARYTLHPATQRFIHEAHGLSPELRIQTHRRLGDHLEAAAKESPDINTYIEAGHHLFEAREYDRASILLFPASHTRQERGRVREGLGMLEPFLNESVQAGMDRSLLGELLGAIGIAHSQLSETQKAIGYYEQQLVISHQIGDRQGESNVLGNLGIAYRHLGEVQKAIGYHEQALEIARQIGDRQGEGNDLGSLGTAYERLGEVHKAIGYHEQRRIIARQIGYRQIESNALGNLGKSYARLDEVQKATSSLQEALAIGEQIGDPQIVKGATRHLENL